ncbi:acetoacetyl-CoA synthetase [Caerostris extrusa]|uniref:Acetoacetyl-CoA synthetase n=1 Tax=Caerostris extrusa TaxID=172846 RepID=A0AAV4VTC5_CAEEX|nr:acetoacetyl-CoA synthetase [Caerostris extrusa]
MVSLTGVSKNRTGILDNEWFSGARLNFAENLLRIRDNRIALICADEHGNEETVTYAEMFEEVQEYAAAFRKQGVTVGDRVTCISSNRKEALYAMLATTSIGAIWGGLLPCLGVRSLNINLNLTKENTFCFTSILLEDFLFNGRADDGKIPDITFEQLPFNHPTAINFTSGTTGIPKGVVHSAGSFISQLRDFGIHYNLKSGDTIYTYCPVGWSVWDDPIPSLALGVTLVLFNGSPQYGWTFWDCLSKYRVTYAALTPAYMDNLEKANTVPGATEVFGNFSGFDLRKPALLVNVKHQH